MYLWYLNSKYFKSLFYEFFGHTCDRFQHTTVHSRVKTSNANGLNKHIRNAGMEVLEHSHTGATSEPLNLFHPEAVFWPLSRNGTPMMKTVKVFQNKKLLYSMPSK